MTLQSILHDPRVLRLVLMLVAVLAVMAADWSLADPAFAWWRRGC
jgi:hypothetical protein